MSFTDEEAAGSWSGPPRERRYRSEGRCSVSSAETFSQMPAQSVETRLPDAARHVRMLASHNDATDSTPAPTLVRLASGSTRGIGLARLGSECLQRIVAAPEFLLQSAIVWLKNTSDRRVALIAADASAADETWCCKVAVSRSWRVRFTAKFVAIRSWNAFHQGVALRKVNVSTPQPLAIVTVVRDGAYHEYLLTETVPNAMSVRQWFEARDWHGGDKASRLLLAAVIRQLAQQLRRLHAERFDHRDLKPSNILLDDANQIWLIDLDGVCRWSVLPKRRRVQNLARLWAGLAPTGVTATDALRFLFEYLPPAQRHSWKRLWCNIVRRAAPKIEQKRREQELTGA